MILVGTRRLRLQNQVNRFALMSSTAVALVACGSTQAATVSAVESVELTSSPLSEVVVVGHKADAASAQIASDHQIEVLSGSDLSRAPDNNMAEALARLPGVALVPVTTGGSLGGTAFMVDDAARGEGGYISVRGLGPDYTLNLMNGADIAEGKPATRQVSLALLPPLGFSQIEISKSDTAAQEGDAISGIVNFQDATAFDIGKPLTSLAIRGDFSQNNADYGFDRGALNGGALAQGEIARTFNAGSLGEFGLHAVAYYSKRNFSSSVFNENEGAWDFLNTYTGSDHTPVNTIDPTKNLIGEQLNSQVSYGTTKRWGGNASIDWRGGGENTLFLRGSYAKSDTKESTAQRGPQAYNQDASLNANGTYTTIEDQIVGSYWFETDPERAQLSNLQFGGTTAWSGLHMKALAFGSYAEDDRPNHVEMAYKNFNLDPTASLAPTYVGDPAYPVPNLSAAQLAQINDLSNYTPQTASNFGSAGVVKTIIDSNQLLGGAKLDFLLDTGSGWLPDVRFGAKFSASRRRATDRDYEYDNGGLLPGQSATLAGNSLIDGSVASPMVGAQRSQYPYLTPLLDADALDRYISGLPLSLASAGYGVGWTDSPAAAEYNRNINTQTGTERVTAGYVEAPMLFGRLTVTPGLRFEHTDISNTFWSESFDADGTPSSGGFQSNAKTYNEALPSLFATWRPSVGSVYRAAYWTSYVKPSLFLLGGSRTVTSLGDGVIQIQEGNPDLKPVLSRNFDVSAEWGASEDRHLSVAGFYKVLSDYLFDAGSSTRGDGTHYVNTLGSTQTGTTVFLRPQNGGAAHAYGMEVAASQRLSLLPGPLANLRLGGNLTVQHTDATLHLSGIADGGPMQYAPELTFNSSLSYIGPRLTAAISYRYTGKFLETYYTYSQSGTTTTGAASANSDISWWDQALQRVDFSARYKLTEQLDVSFEAQNLANNVSYYATRGKDSNLIPQIVQPGRSYFVTLAFRL